MILSPLKEVKAKFESKKKLVESLVSHLEKQEGEKQDAFTKRLMKASNSRLLKLHRRFSVNTAKPAKKK